MTQDRALKLISAIKPSEKTAPFRTRLTPEQFECLSRCARGISVRFERQEIIDALIAGGYVEKGVAGVITMTARGQGYLRTHSS
jgi:predicted metal-binding protein